MNINEEQINEFNKIPLNFAWNSNTGTYVNVNNEVIRKQGTTKLNKSEFYQSVVNTVSLMVRDYLSGFLNKDLTDTDFLIIKNSIRNKIIEKFGGYKKYFDIDFISYLSNSLNQKNDLFNILTINDIIEPFNTFIYKQYNMKDYQINE